MWKLLTALSALTLLGLAGSAQDAKKTQETRTQADQKTATEYANLTNPVKASPNSLAEGKRLYGIDCAMCHGMAGDGKGDLARDMKLALHDWRDPAALQTFTDGDLFQIIAKGKGKMVGDDERMKPEQIWDTVNYVRSFAKKDSPPKPKEADSKN
jgi:mono/diheme cytochrome c family protein